jgi:hypothetical protein
MVIGIPIISFTVAYSWPAALVWYFFCNTAWGFIQALILKNAAFRKRFGLYPLNARQSQNPLARPPGAASSLNIAQPKIIDVAPTNKQIGAKGGLLDMITGGGADEKGSSWSLKNLTDGVGGSPDNFPYSDVLTSCVLCSQKSGRRKASTKRMSNSGKGG